MSPTFTAATLAALAADRLKLDAGGQTRLHRVFRNLVDKGVLEVAVDSTDGRAPRLFDESDAAIALLLFPLARMAVDVRTLRKIAVRVRALDTVAGGVPIQTALVAVKAGKTVTLIVTPGDDLAGDEIHARFEIEGDGPAGDAAIILADYAAACGEPLARWTILANPLLSVLVPKAGA
jgi:hypothetical protein